MDPTGARAVLGVAAGASWGDVRDAYRREVRAHHPDGARDAADATVRTVHTALITQAYAVLLAARDVPPGTSEPVRAAGNGAGPVGGAGDTRCLLLDADPAESFAAMLEVGHVIGTVSYVDRSSGVLEVIVTPVPGEATSLVVDLEASGRYTQALLGVEPLGRHRPAPLDELVDRIAALLASPRPPVRA